MLGEDLIDIEYEGVCDDVDDVGSGIAGALDRLELREMGCAFSA